ncbi:MAG: hypothetical protein LQ342_002246 [Letrouitia transgressa]|nr:MAG: hypothetical protein LQ342_002246 [Letrouitia transgressa]
MSVRPHGGASRLCGTRRRFQEHYQEQLQNSIIHRSGQISNTPNPHSSGAHETLFRLLTRAHVDHVTKATDPRDKIFALLGMAADATSLGILPDYRQSSQTVYTEMARAVIGSGQIDLLSLCQFPKCDLGHSLPTWVPDWSSSDWHSTLVKPCGQFPWDTAFSASGASSFQPPSTHNALFPTHLKLRGCQIDNIETIRVEWEPGPDGCKVNSIEVKTYLNDIESLCSLSNNKVRESGVEIYTHPEVERELAHIRVPIADQEQGAIGFTRRSTLKSSRGYQEVLEGFNNITIAEGSAQSEEAQSYYNMMGRLRFRRPFISTKGFVGLGPGCTQAGDTIAIILGAKFPYILRRVGGRDQRYTLVGEAYVQGIMYGEFMQSGVEIEEFIII